MPPQPAPPVAPSIVVHGGAWAIPAAQTAAALAGVAAAAHAGHAALRRGAPALDAVEAAVRVLEDDAAFDAGRGSCLTARGTVEMDAAVMADCAAHGVRAGAVAAVSRARHPVSLARLVLHRTPHVLLVGAGADRFAREAGAELAATADDLVTPAARDEWRRFERYGAAVDELFNRPGGRGHDTVGAVARDRAGELACATSTGGITFKRAGRVGDSPIVGAGLFCERGVGACSTTGHGESILKVGLARLAVMYAEMGAPAGEAVRRAVARMKEKTGGCGGVVMLDAEGEWAREFSTERMAWAAVGKDGVLRSGIDRDDRGTASGNAPAGLAENGEASS